MEEHLERIVKQAQTKLPNSTCAFEDLTNRYYPLVRQVGRRVVGNSDDADTVAQDVMMRVFQHLPELKEPAAFEGWLRQITTNTAKFFFSREFRERTKAERLYCEQQIAPPNSMEQEKAKEPFDSMLADLNLEERSILALRFVEDLRFAEISAHTGLKLSAIKMRYYRALAKLRKQREPAVSD